MTTIKSLSISVLSLLVIVSLAGCGSGGGSVPSAGNGSGGGSVPSADNGSGGGSVPSADNPPASGSGGGATSTGVAKLSWAAPTTYSNGTPITGLTGYKICYGTSPGTYTSTIDAGMTTSYSVNGLAPGTYYFTVKAYDSFGNESSYSNEAKKIVI